MKRIVTVLFVLCSFFYCSAQVKYGEIKQESIGQLTYFYSPIRVLNDSLTYNFSNSVQTVANGKPVLLTIQINLSGNLREIKTIKVEITFSGGSVYKFEDAIAKSTSTNNYYSVFSVIERVKQFRKKIITKIKIMDKEFEIPKSQAEQDKIDINELLF